MSTERSPLLGSSNSETDIDSSKRHPHESPKTRNICHTDTSVDHFHVYRRRWWIIVVFSLCSVTQGAQWNAWSPILDAVQIGYDWSDSFVAMFPAASNAGFVLLGFPVMYLIEMKGLRVGAILCVCLIMLTMTFWNIALGAHQSWMVVFGSLFNGVSAAFTMAGPPLLSSLWFPVHERTTATALAAGSGYIGTGVSFLSGPYISGVNVATKDIVNSRNISSDTALTVLCFLCVLLYFPSKPPKPPTRTAEAERSNFWHGVKSLFRNPSFILLNIAYNVPNGTYNSWLPLISVGFRPLGISEKSAGWIGFASIMAGCVGSVLLSIFTDHFKRRMKQIVVTMNVISIVGLTILVCVQENYISIPQHDIEVVLYVLCIVIGIGINGAVPLYYELGCEMAYPVHEGLTCSFITIANNIFGMLYFLILLVPRLGSDTQWMTWTALGTCVMSLPLLAIIKESFRRLDIDQSNIYSNNVTDPLPGTIHAVNC